MKKIEKQCKDYIIDRKHQFNEIQQRGFIMKKCKNCPHFE